MHTANAKSREQTSQEMLLWECPRVVCRQRFPTFQSVDPGSHKCNKGNATTNVQGETGKYAWLQRVQILLLSCGFQKWTPKRCHFWAYPVADLELDTGDQRMQSVNKKNIWAHHWLWRRTVDFKQNIFKRQNLTLVWKVCSHALSSKELQREGSIPKYYFFLAFFATL